MKLHASTIRYGLLSVCIVSHLSAQTNLTGLACVTDLTVPVYRGALWLSRASGNATASVTVGPEGQPTSVEIRSEVPALVGWLQFTMKEARFATTCSGQHLEIKFVYRLVGTPIRAPQNLPPNEVTIRGENTFEIEAPPPVVGPIQAD